MVKSDTTGTKTHTDSQGNKVEVFEDISRSNDNRDPRVTKFKIVKDETKQPSMPRSQSDAQKSSNKQRTDPQSFTSNQA